MLTQARTNAHPMRRRSSIRAAAGGRAASASAARSCSFAFSSERRAVARLFEGLDTGARVETMRSTREEADPQENTRHVPLQRERDRAVTEQNKAPGKAHAWLRTVEHDPQRGLWIRKGRRHGEDAGTRGALQTHPPPCARAASRRPSSAAEADGNTKGHCTRMEELINMNDEIA